MLVKKQCKAGRICCGSQFAGIQLMREEKGRCGFREWPVVMMVRADSTVCSHFGGPTQKQMVTWVGVRVRVQPSKPALALCAESHFLKQDSTPQFPPPMLLSWRLSE